MNDLVWVWSGGAGSVWDNEGAGDINGRQADLSCSFLEHGALQRAVAHEAWMPSMARVSAMLSPGLSENHYQTWCRCGAESVPSQRGLLPWGCIDNNLAEY